MCKCLWGVTMQGVLSAAENARLIVAANGATIMLVLLASRWCFSIIGMINSGSSKGRSISFNLVALAAYVAGAAHFIDQTGSAWLYDLTGIFFALNIALILIDTSLIVDYSDTPTTRVFMSVAALCLGVVFFLGLVDLTAVADAIEYEKTEGRFIRE